MTEATQSSPVIRFEGFEVSLHTGELRRNGEKVRLPDQSFQVLAMFLAKPGDVVTRHEIQQRLWSNDTVVEFENSINAAVKNLRLALRDSADQPRYIETLPRRGYRFIAPISNELNGNVPPAPMNSGDSSQGSSSGTSSMRPRRKKLFLAIVAPVLLIGAFGLLRWKSRVQDFGTDNVQTARLSDRDTIVLADFTNNTNDVVFDETLKTALWVALRQSPFLNILSETKVATTLRLMVRPANSVVGQEVAQEVCQRTGSKAYVTGSIATLGNQYVLGLRAVNCQNGDTLAQEQATAAVKEHVLDALGEAASRLRGELGESLVTVQKLDVPLSDATTSSLEALRAYSLGEKALHEKGEIAALPYHEHAIELDPDFAMGYQAVAADYYGLAEVERASRYFRKAYELRDHASEREKLQITADYYRSVTGELDKAGQTLQDGLEIYPREYRARLDLGVLYAERGDYEKSLESYREGLRLSPDSVAAYDDLANSLLALNRFQEAHQTIQQAQARRLGDSSLHAALYALAFLRRESPAMAEHERWFASKPEEDYGLSLASDSEAYAGHLGKARDLTRRSVTSAIGADSKETGAIWQEIAAQREAAFGNFASAKRAAEDGLKLGSQSKAVDEEAALALAMSGDAAQAKSLAESLNKRFPQDTQLQALWLPSIKAQLALGRHDSVLALKILQTGKPIELGQVPFVTNIACLYPSYLRGEAFLAAGQGTEAAVEFEKILEHNGIVWNCWTGARAHLGLARAHALESRTMRGADADAARLRAIVAYEDFLTLWKDADADIPILKEAKAEHAKLY